MNQDQAVIIAKEKLTDYLLIFRNKDDKSKFLQQGGYNIENWQVLEIDLKELYSREDAIFDKEDAYGQFYKIEGSLIGPNGTTLEIITIWMYDKRQEVTKFITLYPNKN